MQLPRPLICAALLATLALPAVAAPASTSEQTFQELIGRHRAHMKLHPSIQFARALPGQMAMPFLHYNGGRVLANVKLVAVYWESNGYFAGAAGQQFIADTNAFYSAFAVSPQFGWLSEYSTTPSNLGPNVAGSNQTIGPGSFGGFFVIHPILVPDTTIDDASVERELSAQIDAGHVPPPDANTLYQVHFAPGISISLGTDRSCVIFCAYHSSYRHSNKDVYYSSIPDHSPPSACATCGETGDWYQSMTRSASHEAMEAITDADVGTSLGSVGPAWYDAQGADFGSEHAEIGDICEADFTARSGASQETGTVGRFTAADSRVWTVQREWSNHYKACITDAAGAFSLSVSPASQTVHGPGTYDFTVSSTAAAGGPVDMVLGNFAEPNGISVSFTPATITAGQTATMHVTVPSGSQPFNVGVFGCTKTASGACGNTLAYALADLTFDDFDASASGTIKLHAGGSTQVQIATSTKAGSASQQVTVQLTGKPPGVTMAANPSTVTSGGSFLATLTAAPGVPTLTNGQLTFALSNGLLVHTLPLAVQIDGDDFTATADAPAPLSVPLGNTARFHIATTTAHGNPQTLTPSAKQVPPGVTLVFDPPSVQSGSPITVTVQAAGSAPAGLNQMVVTVSGAQVSTDLTVEAMLVQGGCSTSGAPLPAFAALALLALWQRRRRAL